jgi:hypothetical protein
MDQPRQALNFYMIAAHMSRKVSKHSSAADALRCFITKGGQLRSKLCCRFGLGHT